MLPVMRSAMPNIIAAEIVISGTKKGTLQHFLLSEMILINKRLMC